VLQVWLSFQTMCSGLQPSNSSLGTVTFPTGPCDRQLDASCSDSVPSSAAQLAHAVKSQFISTSTNDDREDIAPFDSSDSVELLLCVARALVLAIEAPRNPDEVDLDEQAEGKARRCLFESSVVPNITVDKYLRRLKTGFKCSDTAFVLALIIVDRLLENPAQEPHRLTVTNVHRLFLASLIAAVKYNEDLVYGNAHYARCGGIQLKEVNRLELHLFRVLGYSFYVHPDTYDTYRRSLSVLSSQVGPVPAPKVAARSDEKSEVLAAQTDTSSQLRKKQEAEATRSGATTVPKAWTGAGYAGGLKATPQKLASGIAPTRPEFRAWSEASTASSPCGSVMSVATWNPNASPFYPKAASVEPKSRLSAT